MPGTFGKNFFNPDFEWGFMTVRIASSSSTHTGARDTDVVVGPPKTQQR